LQRDKGFAATSIRNRAVIRHPALPRLCAEHLVPPLCMGSPEAFYALCDHRNVLNVRAGTPKVHLDCLRSPQRSSNLDSSNPSGSKSLFDIGSRVSTSGSLTRQVIRLTTRNVRRGGLFCHSNRAADQETVSQRRAHRGGKAGIERRISWALEQIYLGWWEIWQVKTSGTPVPVLLHSYTRPRSLIRYIISADEPLARASDTAANRPAPLQRD